MVVDAQGRCTWNDSHMFSFLYIFVVYSFLPSFIHSLIRVDIHSSLMMLMAQMIHMMVMMKKSHKGTRWFQTTSLAVSAIPTFRSYICHRFPRSLRRFIRETRANQRIFHGAFVSHQEALTARIHPCFHSLNWWIGLGIWSPDITGSGVFSGQKPWLRIYTSQKCVVKTNPTNCKGSLLNYYIYIYMTSRNYCSVHQELNANIIRRPLAKGERA